jgi:hypothetical protein
VKLSCYRVGTIGDVTVEIKGTTGDAPSGGVLASGTYDASGLTTDSGGEYITISLGAGTNLTATTKYALYLKYAAGDASNCIVPRYRYAGATYAGGIFIYTDDGSSWDTSMTDSDIYFEEWGDPTDPTLETDTATNVGTATARLNGELISLGGDDTFDCTFLYGETLGYGSETSPASTLTVPGTYYFDVAGLDPNTTYHFIAKAVGDTTIYGSDLTFKTSVPYPISIYYTASELTALIALKTAPSHSAIYGNIKTWADTHIADESPAEISDTDWYAWIQKGDEIRRYLDSMTLMYHLTDDTDYADAAVHWMVDIAGWTKWSPLTSDEYCWGRSRFMRAYAYAFSALKDYMSAPNKATIIAKMEDVMDEMTAYLDLTFGIDTTNKTVSAYANHWGTIGAALGLGTVALGDDSANYADYLAITLNCVDEYLDRCGDDGSQYEAIDYTVSPMSFIIPFLVAYREVEGIDYFTTYGDFLSNHPYLYIYTHYYLGKNCWIPVGDDEAEYLGIYVNHPDCNPLDDVIYPLATQYNNGYAQMYADTYCSQNLAINYIWKSGTTTSLALSGLPKSRAFTNLGIYVMREDWTMTCEVVIFKCGRSASHASPNQNSFTVVNDGVLITGQLGYDYQTESDTRMQNTMVVNDAIVRDGTYSSTGGQVQEPGDYQHYPTVSYGVSGIIENTFANAYYRYVRGDASPVYIGDTSDATWNSDLWTGSEGGTVTISISGNRNDTHTAGTLLVALRQLVWMEGASYFVVYDRVTAGASAEHMLCLNGRAGLSLAGDTITVNTDEMTSVVLYPASFHSSITEYIIDKGWVQHDYQVIRLHPAVNAASQQFLTAHFMGDSPLITNAVTVGNCQGVIVDLDGTHKDLVLFSSDGSPVVSQEIELGDTYVADDGGSYTFNGTKLVASFSDYQVVRLVESGGSSFPLAGAGTGLGF